VALSRFHLTWDQFLDLCPVEFWLALKDHERCEEDKVKPVCEAIRMSTLWLVNVQLPKKYRVKKKEKIMSFAWDKNRTKRVPQTAEQMKSVFQAIVSDTHRREDKKKNKKR
jgi:hypothetical protein